MSAILHASAIAELREVFVKAIGILDNGETIDLPQTLTYEQAKPGTVIGDCTIAGIAYNADGKPHAVGLLKIKPERRMNWEDAMNWPKGAAADLPSRAELSVLYHTLRNRFEKDAYWSNEPYAGNASYAWYQHFRNGDQWDYNKDDELLAVAVRRFPIQ
jgi:hypothetical protein